MGEGGGGGGGQHCMAYKTCCVLFQQTYLDICPFWLIHPRGSQKLLQRAHVALQNSCLQIVNCPFLMSAGLRTVVATKRTEDFRNFLCSALQGRMVSVDIPQYFAELGDECEMPGRILAKFFVLQ